jgi:GNAT superfamily N-acetyltransferase
LLTEEDTSTSRQEDSGPLVGFVHYRFVLEEDVPVLYVYELQLESRVQGKGLGKFLMEHIELIAQKVLNYFSQPTLASMIVENCCYVAEDTTYNL